MRKHLFVLLCSCLIAALAAQAWLVERRLRRTEQRVVKLSEQLDAVVETIPGAATVAGPSRATSPARIPEQPIRVPASVSFGAADAPVVIIEFTDFHCPFCRRHTLETAPLLEREFVNTGKVRYVVWALPLTRLHPNALSAAVGGQCAYQQGKFLEMRQFLFGAGRSWRADQTAAAARATGVDEASFRECIADQSVSEQIERGIAVAASLDVTSTPTFFLGVPQPDGAVRVVRRIAGAQPFPVFKAAVRQLVPQL